PIYQEVLPRELTSSTQDYISQETIWYVNSDKSINMNKLLESFTQFFREHSDAWLEKFEYKEAGPHLLLMAFLQRIINGSGKIHREYALGRRRMDLLIEWPRLRLSDIATSATRATSYSNECSHRRQGYGAQREGEVGPKQRIDVVR
ncbi:MAG: hypothetical protein PHH73_06390, partial [Candidatus Rickettsiella isopodorum]|nr:hypothetical protein [Candidatus Rickettsiella isopodorum]